VRAKEITEKKLHRVQGSALRWPLYCWGKDAGAQPFPMMRKVKQERPLMPSILEYMRGCRALGLILL